MTECRLDATKLNSQERHLRKKYLEDWRDLKLNEFEFLVKEAGEIYESYKNGFKKDIRYTWTSYHNIEVYLREIMDLQEEIEYIDEVIRDYENDEIE